VNDRRLSAYAFISKRLMFSASDYSDAWRTTAGAGMLLAKIMSTIEALNY
jgi:hypothetical protein